MCTSCTNVHNLPVTSNPETFERPSWHDVYVLALHVILWSCYPRTNCPIHVDHQFWGVLSMGRLVLGWHVQWITCEASSWKLGRLVWGQHVFWEYLSRGAYEHWGDLCGDNMCIGTTCHREVMIIGASCRKGELYRDDLK